MRQRFLIRCADQLGQLKAIACEGGPLPQGAGDPLVRIAHSLAGAAGTFGFPGISARASELETLLIEQPHAARAALDTLIAEIERTLE